MTYTGADPGFFLGGGALVSCSTSTPINHVVFFILQNTSCIRKPQVIGGGGVHTPCTLPLDPPLVGITMINLTNNKLWKRLGIFHVLAKLETVPCISCNVPNVLPSMPSFLRVPYLPVMISGSRYRLVTILSHWQSPLYSQLSRKRPPLVQDEVVAYGR